MHSVYVTDVAEAAYSECEVRVKAISFLPGMFELHAVEEFTRNEFLHVQRVGRNSSFRKQLIYSAIFESTIESIPSDWTSSRRVLLEYYPS